MLVVEASPDLVDAFERCEQVVADWAGPPRTVPPWYWERPTRARMYRRLLAAIAAAWSEVRYSRRAPYVRARQAASYALLGVFTFGLVIVIVFALQ